MRWTLICILVCIAVGSVSAQEMTLTEAEAIYKQAKSQSSALEYHVAFEEEMQALHDEEHGTNVPNRLFFFDAIRKNKKRNKQTDQTILAPWLIRYLWVTRHPTYTQGAVRLLKDLALDDALREVMSKDVLQNHPHGLARAAVIEPTDEYKPSFVEIGTQEFLFQLATNDPHPDVRRNALERLEGVKFPASQLADALKSDPAGEVRVLWATKLVSQVTDSALSEPILLEALMAPKNASVAVQMMKIYLSSGKSKSDLQRLSQGINYLAANKNHPQKPLIINTFGWQVDEDAVPTLLKGAPFADGEALRLWLHTKFANGSAPLIERGYALEILSRRQREIIDVQVIADFMLDPAHTNTTLAPVFDFSLGSFPIRRMFANGPNALVSQAKARKELVARILSFYSEVLADGKPRAASMDQIGLLTELKGVLPLMTSTEDQDWLVQTLLNYASRFPDDVTYGVSGLLEDRGLVDNQRFYSYLSSRTDGFETSINRAFLNRIRPGPWKDPLPKPGDLELAVQIIELAEKLNPGKPDDAYQDVYELIYGLPKKSDLPTNLSGLSAFESKLREMQSRAQRKDGYWAISYWFGEG